jgi:hypothetical protein
VEPALKAPLFAACLDSHGITRDVRLSKESYQMGFVF